MVDWKDRHECNSNLTALLLQWKDELGLEVAWRKKAPPSPGIAFVCTDM